MGLDGIAISGRGALAQAFRLEALIKNLSNSDAKNGQRVGDVVGKFSGEYGQLVGLGKFSEGNGQRVGSGDREVDGQLAGLGKVGQYGDNGQRVGVLETAEMLAALRALEANLQALRIQDATLERTVNELARPAK